MHRFALLLLCLFLFSSNTAPTAVLANAETLNLKWNKAYPEETIEKATLGLQWTLSFVGAILPSASTGISTNIDTITIRPDQLGFDEKALQKLMLLHLKIRNSDEYQKTNAIDLGRYVALLIGASEHYYALIGVPSRIDEILKKYSLLPETGYINHSGVSYQHRIIQFSEPKELNQLLVSTEIDSVSKAVIEYETIEIIPNGQLRFGIFDAAGNRKNSAEASHSDAGKPAKCIWCHESKISQMFNKQNNQALHLTYQQLQDKLITYNRYLTDQKVQFKDGVRYSELQQHTLSELLYITFMEPSAERLSIEWNISIAQTQSLLSNLSAHQYTEFPFLGNLYYRKDIEKLAPFKGLPVSSGIRETSEIEVNYINE